MVKELVKTKKPPPQVITRKPERPKLNKSVELRKTMVTMDSDLDEDDEVIDLRTV